MEGIFVQRMRSVASLDEPCAVLANIGRHWLLCRLFLVATMLELHQFRHSAFCLKVRMVLQAKGLSYRTVDVSPGIGQLACLLYTSPSPRDGLLSRMPSSA